MNPVVHALLTFPPLWFGAAATLAVLVWLVAARFEPHGWRHNGPASYPQPPRPVRARTERIGAIR